MWVLIDCVVVPITAAAGFSLWSRTPLARRVFLEPPTALDIEGSHPPTNLVALVGVEGRVQTPLRPTGFIEIKGRRLEARAQDGFVPEGATVLVVQIQSGQLVVRTIAEAKEVAALTAVSSQAELDTGPDGPTDSSSRPEFEKTFAVPPGLDDLVELDPT
jgi:hypothetical protein